LPILAPEGSQRGSGKPFARTHRCDTSRAPHPQGCPKVPKGRAESPLVRPQMHNLRPRARRCPKSVGASGKPLSFASTDAQKENRRKETIPSSNFRRFTALYSTLHIPWSAFHGLRSRGSGPDIPVPFRCAWQCPWRGFAYRRRSHPRALP
jgi:hypothetical protein